MDLKAARSTGKALLISLFMMVLSISMLSGVTLAWFNDSVSSGVNVIESGNLDISLEYWNGNGWSDVAASSDILDKNANWEPGHVEVVYLKIANRGSLSAKCRFGVNVALEKPGMNADGDPFMLSQYIYYEVIASKEPGAYPTRESAIAATTDTNNIAATHTRNDTLSVGDDPLYLAMIIYMPESVDNVANHDGVTLPSIELGITVKAAQNAEELDGFGSDYDKDATYPN